MIFTQFVGKWMPFCMVFSQKKYQFSTGEPNYLWNVNFECCVIKKDVLIFVGLNLLFSSARAVKGRSSVGFVHRAGNIPLWTVSHSDFPLSSPKTWAEWPDFQQMGDLMQSFEILCVLRRSLWGHMREIWTFTKNFHSFLFFNHTQCYMMFNLRHLKRGNISGNFDYFNQF